MDHSNIFVFIAATYTPFALILLDGTSQLILLVLVWLAALGGLLFRLCWLSAPRWLYTVLYILMGWAALGWLQAFYYAAGPAVLILLVVGGICYTLGAVVYARKRPNPSPAWFGFHEIFHVGTIGGFACHYAAISMISYAR
jgi:hemolysin III